MTTEFFPVDAPQAITMRLDRSEQHSFAGLAST